MHNYHSPPRPEPVVRLSKVNVAGAAALLASRDALRDVSGVAAPGGQWVADVMRDG